MGSEASCPEPSQGQWQMVSRPEEPKFQQQQHVEMCYEPPAVQKKKEVRMTEVPPEQQQHVDHDEKSQTVEIKEMNAEESVDNEKEEIQKVEEPEFNLEQQQHVEELQTEQKMSTDQEFYEQIFAKSDKTDAILVVDGAKLYVNKMFLSCQSDYFDRSFNLKFSTYYTDYIKSVFDPDFKRELTEELKIENVDLKDFATVLSLVHKNSISPTKENVEKLLELADRFDLPAATRYLGLFLQSTDIPKATKIRLADKYEMEELIDHTLGLFQDKEELLGEKELVNNCSEATKAKVLDRIYSLC
uniref:BTB domain-containing protein n=1 Tax=Caenorhabditis tropicalis TaxID=1561998 RepID=A0A1I7UI52_9PELO